MRKQLKLDAKCLNGFVDSDDFEVIKPEVEEAYKCLMERSGKGKEFLGWLEVDRIASEVLLEDIENTAKKMIAMSEAIVVIGVGGSYLGAKAVIKALSPKTLKDKIFFAGQNISGEYISGLLGVLKDKDISVIVISKSGTTTETAIAFRIIEDFLEEKYDQTEVAKRIICITDKEKGALRNIAEEKGLKSFIIPEDVGGRFSILTPVGLLPAACAGIDIRELVSGAVFQRKTNEKNKGYENLSCKYAAIRNILYRKGKRIEIFSTFSYKLRYIGEWWKQLFGESEGKSYKSIFPAACDFSMDLHSMGQLIQEGERNIFETFFIVEEEEEHAIIPERKDNLDNLNYLAGYEMSYVNKKAYEATIEAHHEGGVPSSTIFIPQKTDFYMGALFYFLEEAVAVSAYISGVNPFNQPGVEAYKNKMFKLLGKP